MAEERKSQRQGSNSTLRLAESFGNFDPLLPPPGVVLRNEEEMTIWDQFTRARARSDWRDLDLILLAKVVRTEADIRKYQLVLDGSGPITTNKRGTLVLNPLLTVIDTLQRQQLAIIRSMSLTTTASDPRTVSAQAATEREAQEALVAHGAQYLIAPPQRFTS